MRVVRRFPSSIWIAFVGVVSFLLCVWFSSRLWVFTLDAYPQTEAAIALLIRYYT